LDTLPTDAVSGGIERLNRVYPWVVLGISFTTVAAAFGCRAAFALFFVAVLEEFHWSRGLAAGALTLGSVAWTVSAPAWGQMLDRLGPRFVFPAGAGLMAAGFAVSAMTQTVWHYYLGMGLLVGLGFAALPMTSQATVISNWFVRRRGMAMGLAASGIGVGIFLVVPAAERLIGALGWRNAYLMLAGVMLAAVVPLNLFVQRRRPQDIGLLPDFGATGPAGNGRGRHAGDGGVTLATALAGPELLNQAPAATPRPRFGPERASARWGCSWAACSVSTKPILRKTGPVGWRLPSLAALSSRNSTGSMPNCSQISSMTDSAAKAAVGEPGAR